MTEIEPPAGLVERLALTVLHAMPEDAINWERNDAFGDWETKIARDVLAHIAADPEALAWLVKTAGWHRMTQRGVLDSDGCIWWAYCDADGSRDYEAWRSPWQEVAP